jgi:hypothetical protein
MSGGGATSDDRPETGDAAAAGGGRRRTGAPRAGEAAPIVVTWNERQRRPVSFLWRRRRYRVERVLETWILETGWWKDEGHVSCSYWRVRAEGRVFDLRYDRLSKAWALEQALN